LRDVVSRAPTVGSVTAFLECRVKLVPAIVYDQVRGATSINLARSLFIHAVRSKDRRASAREISELVKSRRLRNSDLENAPARSEATESSTMILPRDWRCASRTSRAASVLAIRPVGSGARSLHGKLTSFTANSPIDTIATSACSLRCAARGA